MRIFLAAAMLALWPGVAASDPSPMWAQVGNWHVRADQTASPPACFIYVEYQDGTGMRVGFDPPYFSLGNASWTGLEEGKPYELTMQFDRHETWTVFTEGFLIPSSDLTILTTLTAGLGLPPKWFEEFKAGHFLTIWYGEFEIGTLDLTGSRAASEEVLRCQDAMNEAAPRAPVEPAHPFRVHPTTQDPAA